MSFMRDEPRPDIRVGDKMSGSGTQHHFLRHSLPVDSKGINTLAHFGVSTISEATRAVKRMSQRELQQTFRLVYGTKTFSNNNQWLRRKLFEALGMGSVKTSSSRRTPKGGIQKSRKVFDKAMAGYLAESFDDQYDQELEWEGMPAPLELAMSAEDAALALVNLSGSLSTDFGAATEHVMDEREHKFAASRAVGNPGLISTEVEKGRPLLWYAGTMIGTSDQASHAPGDPDMKNKSTTSRGAIYRSLDHRGSERSVQTGTISPTKLATCASSAAASTAVRSINEKPPASPRHGISGATPPAPAPTPFHVQSVPVAANTQQLAPDCLSLLQGLLRAVMPTTGHLSGPQQARREPLQVTNPPPNGWEQAAISGVPLRAIPLSPSVLRRQDPMLELLQRKIERERGCWV